MWIYFNYCPAPVKDLDVPASLSNRDISSPQILTALVRPLWIINYQVLCTIFLQPKTLESPQTLNYHVSYLDSTQM